MKEQVHTSEQIPTNIRTFLESVFARLLGKPGSGAPDWFADMPQRPLSTIQHLNAEEANTYTRYPYHT